MARKMTFSGAKYRSNGGPDKNEAGKNPKPTYKKIKGSGDESKKITEEEAKRNLQESKKGPSVHPVTGRPMSDADRQKMNKELKYREAAGYPTTYKKG